MKNSVRDLGCVSRVVLGAVCLLLAQSCASGGGAGTVRTSGSGGATAAGGSAGGAGTTATGGTTAASGGSVGSGGRGGGAGEGGRAAGGGGDAGAAGGRGGGAGTGGGTAGTSGRGGSGGMRSGNSDGGPADAVVHDGSLGGNGAYARTAWTASYTCTGTCLAGNGDSPNDKPALAFDGNYQTRWSTDRYQQDFWNATPRQFPLYFTVDMKQVMNVSKVTMHPSCRDIFDAPGTIDVLVSQDGTAFTPVVMNHKPAVPPSGETCPPSATAKATDTVTFSTTPARYIQIKATQSLIAAGLGTADRYWAIGELYVYP